MSYIRNEIPYLVDGDEDQNVNGMIQSGNEGSVSDNVFDRAVSGLTNGYKLSNVYLSRRGLLYLPEPSA